LEPEVNGDAAVATLKDTGVAESEIALVVTVALLIIGHEDIFVATEPFPGLDGLGDKLVNRR